MLTLILAFINAKYKAGYDGLFAVTAILDFYGMLFTVVMIAGRN